MSSSFNLTDVFKGAPEGAVNAIQLCPKIRTLEWRDPIIETNYIDDIEIYLF